MPRSRANCVSDARANEIVSSIHKQMGGGMPTRPPLPPPKTPLSTSTPINACFRIPEPTIIIQPPTVAAPIEAKVRPNFSDQLNQLRYIRAHITNLPSASTDMEWRWEGQVSSLNVWSGEFNENRDQDGDIIMREPEVQVCTFSAIFPSGRAEPSSTTRF